MNIRDQIITYLDKSTLFDLPPIPSMSLYLSLSIWKEKEMEGLFGALGGGCFIRRAVRGDGPDVNNPLWLIMQNRMWSGDEQSL